MNYLNRPPLTSTIYGPNGWGHHERGHTTGLTYTECEFIGADKGGSRGYGNDWRTRHEALTFRRTVFRVLGAGRWPFRIMGLVSSLFDEVWCTGGDEHPYMDAWGDERTRPDVILRRFTAHRTGGQGLQVVARDGPKPPGVGKGGGRLVLEAFQTIDAGLPGGRASWALNVDGCPLEVYAPMMRSLHGPIVGDPQGASFRAWHFRNVPRVTIEAGQLRYAEADKPVARVSGVPRLFIGHAYLWDSPGGRLELVNVGHATIEPNGGDAAGAVRLVVDGTDTGRTLAQGIKF